MTCDQLTIIAYLKKTKKQEGMLKLEHQNQNLLYFVFFRDVFIGILLSSDYRTVSFRKKTNNIISIYLVLQL